MLARIKLEEEILRKYDSLKADSVTDKMTLMMDLEYSKVNLEKLLEADDKTLLHDVNGIMVHMNRKEKRLDNFIPRVGLRKE